MIEKDKYFIYSIAFLYSMIIIIVVSIPAYFYIDIEKESSKQIQMKELERYTLGVEKEIYDFSNSKENIFDFPRSFLYKAYLYDENNKQIFSTNSKTVALNKLDDKKDILYKKIVLNSNRINIRYLLIIKQFSYKEIYQKATVEVLFLGAVIFLLAIFFIKISIHPFEKANRYLNAFFNDAMHELKTPLGVIQLNMEILKARKDSKEIRRLFNSVQGIAIIYEDIEYLIKHKYVDYRPEQINFSIFLQDRIKFFIDIANIKDIEIKEDITPNINVYINRIELQRLIDNTLSNAIKYSDKDKSITATLKKEDTDLVLSIKDRGWGIKNTKNIFDRYHRENSIKGGFGIGLSIVKNICEKNNIVILVDSSVDVGSTFTYKFPFY